MRGIEKYRKIFWEEFTRNFYNEMQNKFSEGPKPFREANESVLNSVRFQLCTFLDSYLVPVIVDYILRNKKDNCEDKKSSAIYNSFFLGSFDAALGILEKNYSETLSIIFDRLNLFRSHFTQACERIFADWQEITEKFAITNNDSIERIRFFTGDIHGSGSQTTIILFNNGEKGFVYKPVDLSIIQFFYDLFAYIKDTLNFSFKKIPAIILKESPGFKNYGYIDFIKYKGDVADNKEAEEVYTNFGKILAFARFFNVADGHADNIVINSPDVFWIDLENAFHFADPELLEAVHPLEVTGLLFEAKKETTLFGIFTGIQGGILPRFSLTQPLVHNDGTDEMFIRYFGITDVPVGEKRNRIYLNGEICKPEDFISNIQEGYLNTIQVLLVHKNKILSFIKDYFSANKVIVRYIFKTTASYCRYINLVTHTTALKRGDVFSHIRKELTQLTDEPEPFKSFIINNEILDLNNLTVPYFYKFSSNRNIYHFSGLCEKDFFSKGMFEEFSDGIEKLNLEEIQKDLIFIEKALQSTIGLETWDQFIAKFDYPQFNYEAVKKQLGDKVGI